MNLILFGFKSCGKTTFGKKLSLKLNLPFIDTDDLFEKKPAELYKTLGETAFRELEKKIIRSLKPDTRSVIALGGGAILDRENLAHIQTLGRLIYLKASFDTIRKRCIQLPAFADSFESLYKIYSERLLVYESIPAQCIEIDG